MVMVPLGGDRCVVSHSSKRGDSLREPSPAGGLEAMSFAPDAQIWTVCIGSRHGHSSGLQCMIGESKEVSDRESTHASDPVE
jgi:hypothetical protein